MAKHRFWFEGGRLSLDFIGSNGARSGELLATAADLSAWLSAAGMTTERPAVSAAQFERALVVRSALSRLVRASIGEGAVQAADVDVVNAAAGQESPRRSLSLRGQKLVNHAVAPDADQCLGVVARDAIDLLGGPERGLLRRCAAEDCSGIYVDRSRGSRRKWCSTGGCGNRSRVSAHRHRNNLPFSIAGQQP